jgi:two-component system, NarL family, sensor histidine kinase UhpB
MLPFGAARTSLRMRMMLIPSGILLIGMLAAVCITLIAARERIRSETQSGVGMASLLIGYALDELATDREPEAAMLRLRRELAQVRHVRVEYRVDPTLAAPAPAETDAAPKWFLALFEPARAVATYPLIVGGVPRGELVMRTWPADEVEEIWNGLIFLAILLAAVAMAIAALLYASAHLALRPLHELEQGLDRLEQGRFEALAEIKISELRRIGERFNRLAFSLARTEAQNHRLVDRLLYVQEAERKELARELHDEYGAALFGIRAAASCIVEAASAASTTDPAAREIGERAQTIARLADSIQKQNYRILDRIQPVVLSQMGLAEALRHLTETWQATHRDCACDLVVTALPALAEDVSLACYRIVQECLTNIARHAQAKQARISVTYDKGDAGNAAGIRLIVEDDGVGLPEVFRSGFGFLGMSERVHKFGGRLVCDRMAGAGTRIEAVIPCVAEKAPPATIEPQTASTERIGA